MKTKKFNCKGASKDLEKIIKEDFKGNNKISFLISERGNQRIEIEDLDSKEIWQTLEALEKVDDMKNFDEISANLIFALFEQCKKK